MPGNCFIAVLFELHSSVSGQPWLNLMTQRDSLLVRDPRTIDPRSYNYLCPTPPPDFGIQTAANIYLIALAQEAVAEPENAVTESHTTANGEAQEGEEELDQGAESMTL